MYLPNLLKINQKKKETILRVEIARRIGLNKRARLYIDTIIKMILNIYKRPFEKLDNGHSIDD